MSKLTHLNSVYLNYLTPLLKWRIMDLQSLRRECDACPSYTRFTRIIRKMEEERIIETYKHRFNGKKYIFFSPFGERQIASEKNATAISKDTLIHDLIVSEISRNILSSNWVDNVLLEHEIQNKRDFRSVYKVIPDASLEVYRNNKSIKMALELELTQKHKQRVREKIKQYIISSKYDYVIYIFSKKNVMETYMNEVRNTLSEKYLDQFIFITDESITVKESNINKLEGVNNGKKISFNNVFVSEYGV